MRAEGRARKRAAVQVPVRLVSAENVRIPESATTLNISRFGARVFTNRRWLAGEEVNIASISGEFRRQARVVYCHPLAGGHFCIGLEFGASMRMSRSAPITSVA
jgi:hypothetical protein